MTLTTTLIIIGAVWLCSFIAWRRIYITDEENNILENIRKMEQRDIMDKRKEIIYERNPDTDEIRSRELMDYDNEKMVNPAVNAVPTITYPDSFNDGVCEGEYDHDAIRGED
jgi:hypothetical protein